MLFDEKKHERGREDEVANATNFLFSRIQELEATVLSQRMALESSRQRELALHNTVAGFQELLKTRNMAIESSDAKLSHLSTLVDALTQKNKALLDDNSELRRRLESLVTAGVTPNNSSSPLALGGGNKMMMASGSYADDVSRLLSNASFSFSEDALGSNYNGGGAGGGNGLNNNRRDPHLLLGGGRSPGADAGDLASTTQQVALLQQQFRDCNKHLNLLIGVLNQLLSSSSTSAPAPRANEAIADVCTYIFERDGSLPTFLYEYLKSSAGKRQEHQLAGGGGGGGHRGGDNSGSSSHHFPSHHQQQHNSSMPAAGQQHTAAVQMLLRRNDELQQKLLELGVIS